MEDRHKRITDVSIAGLIINSFFVILKGFIGLSSGSVSIFVDAINNSTDVLSAIVTLCGIKLARRKPDSKHPFGHGRVEYVAAIVVGLIILSVGVVAVVTSAPKIGTNEVASYSVLPLVVIFVTIVVKFVFGKYLQRVGKETKSRSLEGTGIDALFDALLSFGTLVGGIVSLAFGISVDGIIGVVIAGFIIKTAIEIIGEGLADLIGRSADRKLVRKVKKSIQEVDEVKGVPKVVLHDYGPEDVVGAVKIDVDEKTTVKELKKISEEIEKKVDDELDVDVIVGV